MRPPPLTPLAAAALHVGSPERILVINCGRGEAALFLAREFPRARVRGVDASERTVRQASARIGLDPEGRVAFKAARPPRLPYPDEFFDLVAAVNARPRSGEIARVLRAGGHLILACTEPAHGPSRLPIWWLRRRLSHLGIEPLVSAEAGAGSYFVGRFAVAAEATTAN